MAFGSWIVDGQVVDAHVHAWPPMPRRVGVERGRWPVVRAAVGLGNVVERIVVVTPGSPPGDDAWTVRLANEEGLSSVRAVVRAEYLALIAGHNGGRRCGVRIVIRASPPSREVVSTVREASACGVPVHVQNTSGDWSAVSAWARDWPEATFIVDHLGHPDLGIGCTDRRWQEFCALAAHENVAVKLPNLTHFTGSLREVASLEPFVAAALRAFGPNRLLWASDWPNPDAATYREVLEAGLRLVAHVDADAVKPIFARNATRLLWGESG